MSEIEEDENIRKTLEAEGEYGADYIEGLLDIADLDGDIDIDVRDGRAYLAVNSDDADSQLGELSDARTVAALQDLTRLAVQQRSGSFSRLVLDVQGSRERRKAELAKLVDAAVDRLDSGEPEVALEPMSSYERKLIHDVATERGLESNSDGEGRRRHIVLSAGSSDEDVDLEHEVDADEGIGTADGVIGNDDGGSEKAHARQLDAARSVPDQSDDDLPGVDDSDADEFGAEPPTAK